MGSKKTEFLSAIAMKYLPHPPLSRQYPVIKDTGNYDSIEYLNFKESSGLDKVYLSARYESLSYKGTLEMSDDVNSVANYITGNNNYNANHKTNPADSEKIIELFNLGHLKHKWINSLSNGQLRRARIAKAVLHYPQLLIIDDPFLGLDPKQTQLVSDSLCKVTEMFDMAVVLGLRYQDTVPEWITHITEINNEGIELDGPKNEIHIRRDDVPQDKNYQLQEILNESEYKDMHKHNDHKTNDHKTNSHKTNSHNTNNLYHIEFNNASVIYKQLPILKDFSWKIPKGSNWRILGENGTGKTTILSLITADHPQSWRSVIKINGTLRKTGNGVTFFDVNNRIGISSPELHSLVPPNKTMNEIITNGLVKDIGNSNFNFVVDFQPPQKLREILAIPEIRNMINEYGDTKFNELTITLQKLTLFLRAIIKDPELIILDEAFSCMDDVRLMHICHKILDTYFKEATVLTIGHIEWELPDYDYVIKLVGDEQRSYKLFKCEK